MEGVKVPLDVELPEKQKEVRIYQPPRASREETLEAAQDFYGKIGVQVDFSRITPAVR